MGSRQTVETRLIVEGRPIVVSLISNPLIDDVLVSESKIQAYGIEQNVDLSSRRVSKDLRDFLIRLGVER